MRKRRVLVKNKEEMRRGTCVFLQMEEERQEMLLVLMVLEDKYMGVGPHDLFFIFLLFIVFSKEWTF